MKLAPGSLKLALEVHRDRLIYAPGVIARCEMVCPSCGEKTAAVTSPKPLAAPGGGMTVSMKRLSDLINTMFIMLTNGNKSCDECGVVSCVPVNSHEDIRKELKDVITVPWLIAGLDTVAGDLTPGVLDGARKMIESFQNTP